MVKNWEEFVHEYAKQQYNDAIFNLTKMVEPWFKSPIERVMYVVLRDEFMHAFSDGHLGLEVQKKIGRYTVDFYIFYKSKTGLVEFVIECDGHDFHERTKEQAAHDKKRDRFFTEKGYVVLRYTGSEIFKDYKKITDPIWSIIVTKDQVI